MPRCPRCKKRFKDASRVLNHINQPLGSCHSLPKELVRISDTLRHRLQRQQQQHATPGSAPTAKSPIGGHNVDDDPMDIDGNDFPDPQTQPEHSTDPIVETYPGAAKIHGTGPTFMQSFNADTYAKEREQNLYYPFASKDEWEVASFLTQSNLSMSAIDTFLALNLVSLYMYVTGYHSLTYFRSVNYIYPSILRRTSERVSKFCLRLLSGNVKSWKPCIPPNTRSGCSIAIHWSVSSLFLKVL